jgi:hypothetical protein
MSSVVELARSPYVATSTTSVTQLPATRTPSAYEAQLANAWSALGEALQDELSVVPSATAVDEAVTLLEMLPSGVWPPEPVIEDSGTIAWVWDRWPGKFLALAVNGTGRVQRSAVVDGQRSWDTTAMLDRLSPADLELLAKFSPSHA